MGSRGRWPLAGFEGAEPLRSRSDIDSICLSRQAPAMR